MQNFLDASGLNRYTQALKNGQLIAGRAKDSSKADYAKDASTAFYASHASATGLLGIIPLANLPASVVETLYVVETEAARLALTTKEVQNGDTVKVTATKLMYLVVDDTKLGTEQAAEAFVEYSVGRAAFAQDASHADVATKAVDASNAVNAQHAVTAQDASSADSVEWANVQNKPTEFTPSLHTQDGSTITALTGYTEASSAANVAADDSLLVALGKIEKKADDAAEAAGDHVQDASTINMTGYQVAANYTAVAASDTALTAIEKVEKKALDASNTADWGSITNKPTTYDASIVMMGGYEKKSGNVAATDSALTAVGKVEKKVDDVTTAFEGHTHGAADVSTMAGYNGPAASYDAVASSDTLNQAIAKIEKKALDSSNTADWGSITNKPSEFTPENHAATKVTSLGTYAKASTAENINVNDSLVVALGKLEKKADDAADQPISAATIDAIVAGTYSA